MVADRRRDHHGGLPRIAADLPAAVHNAVASVAGVGPVDVKIVWEPPWTPDRMSDIAKVALDWY